MGLSFFGGENRQGPDLTAAVRLEIRREASLYRSKTTLPTCGAIQYS
jgi:hypothetical protein